MQPVHVEGLPLFSDTRREARESSGKRAELLEAKSLAAIRASRDGLTCDEIAEMYGEDVTSIRPRITKLQEKKLVQDSGRRRLSRMQRPCSVWIDTARA